jgi:hypothetical protein
MLGAALAIAGVVGGVVVAGVAPESADTVTGAPCVPYTATPPTAIMAPPPTIAAPNPIF